MINSDAAPQDEENSKSLRSLISASAELDRLVEAEKAEVAELLEQLMGRKHIRLFLFIDEGIDFRGDEFLQGTAGFFVVAGEEHFVRSSFRGAREASEPGISINNFQIPGSRLRRDPE